MGLTLLMPPENEPVTLEEAKAQCRVLHENEDAYIDGLIRAATRHVERSLGMSLMSQTWRLTLDAFTDNIELMRGPVTEVTSIEYIDAEGDTQTAPTSLYTVDLAGRRQWIVRNSGESWPRTLDGINAVSVTYVAGHDELPAEFEDIKHAILLTVGHWFANREAAVVGNGAAVEVPLAVDALLQPYRWVLV